MFLTAVLSAGLTSGVSSQTAPIATSTFTAGKIVVVARYYDPGARTIEKELPSVVTRALGYYEKVFGGPPKAVTGQPLDTLRLDIGSAPVGGGEADPGIIQLTVGAQEVYGFYDWCLTLLHEMVHLWNAESFRYADDREQWFNEGVAEFYAIQAWTALKLEDPVRATAAAAALVGFYTSAPDLGSLSLRGAGVTPRLKTAHYVLVYCGGFSAALFLDHDMRARTGNARSLDHLMQWLYAGYNRDTKPYGEPDLLAGLKSITGFDYDEFFFRHVDGHQPVPVSTLGLGEFAMAVTRKAAGVPRGAAPDPLLLSSLGLVGVWR